MNSAHFSNAPLRRRQWPFSVGNVDIPQPPPNVVPTPGPPGQPAYPPSPPEIDPPPPPEIKEPPGVGGGLVPVGEPPWPRNEPIRGDTSRPGVQGHMLKGPNVAASAQRHAIPHRSARQVV